MRNVSNTNRLKLCLSLAFIAMVILLITSCDREEQKISTKRKSITFILSSDSPGKNYFALAAEHFRKHDTGKTDIVTSECRSIACVIAYLNDHKATEPWKQINLVAHGNSKTGLNLYLSDGGHKATPKRMVQEVALSTLPKLEGGVVDATTRIDVLACGIGTNPMIALSMKAIFRPLSGSSPMVNCAKAYIIFRPDTNGIVQKLKASYWPYYYKRGYRPSISEIDQQMKALYPRDTQLWTEMIESPTDSSLTKDYHIPVSYIKFYDDKNDRPDVGSHTAKAEWAQSQPQIIDKLAELEMSYDDFTWQIDKRIIKDTNGKKRYAIKAIGMTTALCFLKVE